MKLVNQPHAHGTTTGDLDCYSIDRGGGVAVKDAQVCESSSTNTIMW